MSRMAMDVFRAFVLLVVTGIILYLLDPANSIIAQAVLIALFQVGASHLTRRILFPSLDLQSIAKRAVQENSIAAAMIFMSIVAFLVAVMFLSTQVFK